MSSIQNLGSSIGSGLSQAATPAPKVSVAIPTSPVPGAGVSQAPTDTTREAALQSAASKPKEEEKAPQELYDVRTYYAHQLPIDAKGFHGREDGWLQVIGGSLDGSKIPNAMKLWVRADGSLYDSEKKISYLPYETGKEKIWSEGNSSFSPNRTANRLTRLVYDRINSSVVDPFNLFTWYPKDKMPPPADVTVLRMGLTGNPPKAS